MILNLSFFYLFKNDSLFGVRMFAIKIFIFLDILRIKLFHHVCQNRTGAFISDKIDLI
jgi:hypothetical protein